jgi:hypothetical protein
MKNMILGILSDTHIPVRAKEIPISVRDKLEEVDLILHAGDFQTISVLRELQEIGEVKAVQGNRDSSELKAELPKKVAIEIERFKIGITHGSGPSFRLEKRVRRVFDDVDAIIYGHSHRPKNEMIDGVLFFNPGSPTDKFFAPFNSFGILMIEDEIKGEIIKI